MEFRLLSFLVFGCVVYVINAAAIDNSVYSDLPRINNGGELISSIISNCFDGNTMHCLKENLLTYLDTVIGLSDEQSRGFNEKNIDKMIFDRVGRVLATNEFKIQLPATFFQNTIVSYRPDHGIDVDLPIEEARGDLLKKKLLLPVLLLLKLKMKALMPILVALIGLKAMKALILSKLAITIVVGFVIYQLVQKLGGLKMSMMPMMPPTEPMTAYGAPPATTPASSYEPSWEPSSGGPYSRVWDSGSSSGAQSLAYSAYYPSSSATSSGTSSGTSGSSSPSTSSSSYSYNS